MITTEDRKSKPAKARNPKITWGTIVVTKNVFEVNCVWSFIDQESKVEALKQANNCVKFNRDPQNTYQVSIHYGLNMAQIARMFH
jgi:hypothetical protein